MGKLELNKRLKKEALFNTAFELFTTKGLTKTTISDIVERAGVAKGTFYLYFKDKYDIRNKLVSHKTGELFSAPMKRCSKNRFRGLRNRFILLWIIFSQIWIRIIPCFCLFRKTCPGESPEGLSTLKCRTKDIISIRRS